MNGIGTATAQGHVWIMAWFRSAWTPQSAAAAIHGSALHGERKMRRIGSTVAAAVLSMALSLGVVRAQTPTQEGQDHSVHHPPGTDTQVPLPTAPASTPPGPSPQRAEQGALGTGAAPGAMSGDMGQMMQMMRRMMTMRQGEAPPGAARAFDRIEGQLAYFRTELRVTDAQSPQWNAFADVVRAQSQTLQRAYMRAMQAAGQPTPAPAQLEFRAALLRAQLDATQAVAAAVAPLYAALSDEQKRTADELMAEHLRDMRIRGL